jgi:cellulose synthase/poly-beta-1,6-N-acetylglucosamine synthase-like glycosyltransferase
METLDIITLTLIGLVLYTYLGYPLVLFLFVSLKRKFTKAPQEIQQIFPNVTFLVAAYNEEDVIEAKIKNCFDLNYPIDKIQFLFITDGSTDATVEKISKHSYVQVLHQHKRAGKTAAINRAMPFVTSEITIFSDANTMLNADAILNIVKHYANPKVGCVSGEKRVSIPEEAQASAAGEGLYWKYESKLKNWDAELYSATGAAGELFSIRTALYQTMEEDSILDDFMISMRIVEKGYKIAYAPNAFAVENASENIHEELKRKIRISTGAFQSMLRLLPLLNFFKHGIFSFQYLSHRVIRWTLAPLALLVLLPITLMGLYASFESYFLLFLGQVLFYSFAYFGWKFEQVKTRKKLFFVPFYFTMMNYSVLAGFERFVLGKQQHIWQKANRIAS